MNKVLIAVLSLVVLVIVFVSFVLFPKNKVQNNINNEIVNNTEESIPLFPSENKDNKQIVPLPSEESVVRTFFTLIGEKRPADAISMMTASMMGDESTKQMWGVNFNSVSSLKIISIDPHMKEEWTVARHVFKVQLEMSMKPESASAPIPYYGWNNGLNIRWVSVEKQGTIWKIAEIATGP